MNEIAISFLIIVLLMPFIFERKKRVKETSELRDEIFLLKSEMKHGKHKISGVKKRIYNFVLKQGEPIKGKELFEQLNKIKKIDVEIFATAVMLLEKEEILIQKNIGN